MKELLSAFIGLAGFIDASSASAQGFIGPNDLANVYVRESRTDVALAQAHSNPDGCAYAQIIVVNAGAHPNTEFMVSAALTALAAGKRIKAWVDGCTGDGKAIVDALQILGE